MEEQYINRSCIVATNIIIGTTSMTTVYDSEGHEIGQFDGRFVYDRTSTKCYWIDDGEVFSMPPIHLESGSSTRAAIKVADLTNGVAIDSDGATVFSLQKFYIRQTHEQIAKS